MLLEVMSRVSLNDLDLKSEDYVPGIRTGASLQVNCLPPDLVSTFGRILIGGGGPWAC